MIWQTYFIEFSYLLASILFILGLKGLSHPETAKRGMHMAEFGMMLAIIGTLMHFEIVSYTWIIVGPSCVTHEGKWMNQRVAAAMGANA